MEAVVKELQLKNKTDQRQDEDLNEDELLEKLLHDTGGFGRYQYGFLVTSVMVCIVISMNHLSQIYIGFTQDFDCDQGGSNFTSECPIDSISAECPDIVYDTSTMKRTIVSDFNLVCDRLYLKSIVPLTYMIGILIVNTLAGIVSDRFGRRPVLLVLATVHIVASFLTAFSSSSYWFFLIARFFVGGPMHAVWSAMFVIGSEISIESKRGLTGGILNYGWNLGSLLMTGLAYFLRDWVKMQLSFAIISLSLILCYFLVPESPRWLVQNGNPERAKEIYKKIADRNGYKLKGERADTFERHFSLLVQRIEEAKAANPKSKGLFVSFFSNFTHRNFSWRMLLFCFPLFAVGMSAYGIHFSVELLNFSIFAVVAINEVVILVMINICIPIYDRSQRAPLLLIMYGMAGICGVLFWFFPVSWTDARVVLFIVAQGLIVTDFYLVDTYIPEVFSTDTRSFAFAFLDSVSKLGSSFAGYVVDFGQKEHVSLPPTIFGLLMLASGLVFLITPETKDVPLTQKVEDLGKGKSKSLVRKCCDC